MHASNSRAGLSLLEIILATALLAASGAVLLGLIGQANQAAMRAEQRTFALLHAQTLLEEYAASEDRGSFEMEGELGEEPGMRYRIEAEEIQRSNPQPSTLMRITVTLFQRENEPIVQLTRWARQSPTPIRDEADRGEVDSRGATSLGSDARLGAMR